MTLHTTPARVIEMIYTMTEQEFNALKEASKPVPYMVFDGRPPEGAYDKAMRVWATICDRVGCEQGTVAPALTGGSRDFTAKPTNTHEGECPECEGTGIPNSEIYMRSPRPCDRCANTSKGETEL
jgi:hypothetical protein